jgi:hypothetical protein
MYKFENNFQLLDWPHVLHFVPSEMRKTLSLWLCNVSTEVMMLMVGGIQTLLTVELLKLIPDSG